MTTVASPFAAWGNLAGLPLELGSVYVGVENADPETSPAPVFWDEAMTLPAEQPLRTVGGAIVNAGAPARVYVGGAYSIRVRTLAGAVVFYAPSVVSDMGALKAVNGGSLVGAPAFGATPYLKTVSDIINAEEVLIDRLLPSTQIAAIRAGTSAYDVAPDLNSALADFTNGGGIYAKGGRYYQESAIVVPGSTRIRGDYRATQFYTDLDIEQFNAKAGGQYHISFHDLAVINAFPVSNVAGPGFSGTTTAGSSTIAGIASTAGLYKGMGITGPGIPAGSYIGVVLANSIKIANGVQGLSPTFVNATVGGTSTFATNFRQGATKFHMYLNNVGNTRLHNVYIKGNYVDTDYSPNNMGGVWFDRDSGQQYFINDMDNCWVDHARVLVGTSDSNIKNSVIYGMCGDYAVKLAAPGLTLSGCNVSCGQMAGVWITATAKESNGSLNHALTGNNIDGGGLWQSGYGLFATRPVSLIVSDNKFNILPKAGIYLETPFGSAVSGNLFFETNLDNASYSDVEIASIAFQSSNNVVASNVHTQNTPKSSPGWAIREIPGAFYPAGHSYSASSISGNYQSPAFSITTPLGSAQFPNVSGNGGGGMDAGIVQAITPTLVGLTTAGAPSYGATFGSVDVSNKRVNIQIYLSTFSTLGGMAGSVVVRGAPVAAVTGPGGTIPRHVLSVGDFNGFTFPAGYTQLGAYIAPGSSDITLVRSGSGVANAAVQASELAAVTSISIAGSYRAAT